ncbi:hypothetical protein RHMOL_Rhmol10G0017500 [Rhododendron molle]|uniref:Uncharacterized protein n=1 Tax=Rhododendron molle TaxID=49168 RepID=A0ACC0LYD8_RHOML|nr:hypothetical protein RHMOL_Rhmol10G0017500 [Rhododendron molle]
MAPQDKGRPLPKFGEWDVNNPASTDGFTVIFAKARDDKKTTGTAVNAPPPPRPQPSQTTNNRPRKDQRHQHHPTQQDKGRPLPKFGEWDVNNPASADGFTVIFAKARDDKKTTGTATNAPPPPRPQPSQTSNNPPRKDQRHQHHPAVQIICFAHSFCLIMFRFLRILHDMFTYNRYVRLL